MGNRYITWNAKKNTNEKKRYINKNKASTSERLRDAICDRYRVMHHSALACRLIAFLFIFLLFPSPPPPTSSSSSIALSTRFPNARPPVLSISPFPRSPRSPRHIVPKGLNQRRMMNNANFPRRLSYMRFYPVDVSILFVVCIRAFIVLVTQCILSYLFTFCGTKNAILIYPSTRWQIFNGKDTV